MIAGPSAFRSAFVRVAALLIDSGGVLVRTTGDLISGIAAKYGVRLSASDCVRGVYAADVLRLTDTDPSAVSFAARWGRSVGCDTTTAETVWAEITSSTTESGLWSTPNPQAWAMFAALPRDLPKIVVSNANGGAAQELRNLGLFGHVNAVFDSGNVGVRKPDRRMFEMAALAANVPLAACMYVSDNLDAPRDSELRQVLYDPFDVWPAALRTQVHAVVADLTDLPGLLDERGVRRDGRARDA